MSSGQQFVTVFAGSSIEAGLVSNFLEDHGITAYLDDDNIGVMAPHIAAGGGAGAVKVLVPHDQAEQARTALAEQRAKPGG